MFTHITNHQSIADDLKAILTQHAGRHGQILSLINQFEGADWIPGHLNDAAAAIPGFALHNDRLTFNPAASPLTAPEAVKTLMSRYLRALVAHKTLFGVEEAAWYLGVAPVTIKHHVYKSNLLKGELIGKTLVFTRDELDAFEAERPRPGPRKTGS